MMNTQVAILAYAACRQATGYYATEHSSRILYRDLFDAQTGAATLLQLSVDLALAIFLTLPALESSELPVVDQRQSCLTADPDSFSNSLIPLTWLL